ncbi:hypothetical protein LZ32DRAFT_638021 [Colletotrichum eremochloae]|nr:hypothetical protein LZ32DRAFT_638021 [Colletotrichum eremochloae]
MGGSQINFSLPLTPGVTWTESLVHTPAPKRRHVKCDEVKPSCQRCVKWQGFCEGYSTSGGSSASTPGPDNDLDGTSSAAQTSKSPQVEKLTANGAKPCLPFDDPNLPVDISDNLFGDPTERQYFDHWLACRYWLGGGFFDEPLWNETVPQMSHQHASVRYAAMAVGGIVKALRRSMKPMSPAQMGANGPHYALALSYYGRAIQEIRKAELDTGSLRAAIVCCLLFACFEVLHGDRKAALSHIDNGQRMMDELLRCEEDKGYSVRSVIGAESVEADALHVFQRLIQQSWSCGVLRRQWRDASEEPHDDGNDDDEDDEGGQKENYSKRSWCCRGGSEGERAFHKMPSSFATLQEARRWWDVTQHYVTHSSDIVVPITHLGLGEDLVSECNGRVRRHMDEIEVAFADSDGRRRGGFEDAALERWHDAFAPLWAAARENRDHDESHESIARLTPAYREVVELCDDLLAHQRRSSRCFRPEDDLRRFLFD